MNDATTGGAMGLEPSLFYRSLRRFRAPERLIHVLEAKREINSCNFYLEPNLMAGKVCMALAGRGSFCPDIPSERWNRRLAKYSIEHGHNLYWLPQLSKRLQARDLVGKVSKERPQYFHYLRMELITPEVPRQLCQKDQGNIHYSRERVVELRKYTEPSDEFYGYEMGLEHIRDHNDSRRHYRIGLTHTALQKYKRGRHEGEYYLTMTRHQDRYMPVEAVFRKRITTFHRT